MARKLRVEYPGAVYHVMNRGDRREPIFRDDADRQRFVSTLGEACGKTGWQIHALCLMPNHFHMVVETPRGNLVAGMKWFLGTYTGRFNRRHKLFGHLFSGRYKALIVDGSGNGYLKAVCDYVHLNPPRAKLLRSEQALREYRWSSWPEYLQRPGRRWPWLRTDRLLGEYRIPKDSAAGRRELENALEERRAGEAGADYKQLRRGWCWGAETFRKELLGQMKKQIGAEHYGAEREETLEAHAEGIVAEEMKRRRWAEEELRRRAKGDAGKVAMAGAVASGDGGDGEMDSRTATNGRAGLRQSSAVSSAKDERGMSCQYQELTRSRTDPFTFTFTRKRTDHLCALQNLKPF